MKRTRYLRRYDRFRAGLGSIVEMPERTVDLIFRMLRQNEGKLSKRAQDKEFDKLEPEEVAAIERLYAESFSAT